MFVSLQLARLSKLSLICSLPLPDNIVFQLSSGGFFGTSNRQVTRIVKETSYPQVRAASKVPWLQIVLLLVSFLAMFAGLIAVFVYQANGVFLPPYLIVQFDDEVRPELSTFSGLFTLSANTGRQVVGGVSYWNEIGDGSIGYCADLKAWTFGHSRTTDDFCDGVMAMSESPTNLDISKILGLPWYVRISDDTERILPMEDVYSARACAVESYLDCGGSDHGTCVNGKCVCEPGFFGLRCGYTKNEVCDTIRVDEQTDEFVGLRRTVGFEFNVLKNPEGNFVLAYDHPIYVDSATRKRGELVDVLLYTGFRWMVSAVEPPDDDIRLLYKYFEAPFHASSSTLPAIEATTETVRFNTAADERPAPTKMEWFLPGSEKIAEMDPVLGINTVFVCSECTLYNPCSFNNICNDERACQCQNGERGSLCQVIPVGDGNCDKFFNEQEFGYDGGDCCEASCRSSQNYQCGISSDDDVDVDSVPAGFPFCRDPEYGCKHDEIDCWTPKSNPHPGILLLIKKSSGAFVTLSANGRTLVISEPELDTVRVFDQVDSEWVQRGQTLEGDAKSRFGSFVSMATLPGAVVRRRSGRVPVTIAVASKGSKSNYVEIYAFEPHGVLWVKIGQRLSFHLEEIDAISVGRSGPNITLAVGLRETNRAHVYKKNNLLWQLVFNTTGSSVGLSGDGQVLVCVSTDPVKSSDGSGVFSINSLNYIVDDDIENNKAVTERSLVQPNLLPFGTHSFSFQSRPVRIQTSYDGKYGVTVGQSIPGSFGLFGLSMIGLKRGKVGASYLTERLSDFGVDVNETSGASYAVSPDTQFFAMNVMETFIEMFDIQADDTDLWKNRHPNSSTLPMFDVNSFSNRFAISDRGAVMAVVLDDRVRVVQRSSSCNGTNVRLVVTLDEEPGLVSWSLDYVGSLQKKTYPAENIGLCQNCYAGDPRYTRVVVVEDFCIPKEVEACVQLTFTTERERLGDGAGFIALHNGKRFAFYDGLNETKTKVPGVCQRSCSTDSSSFDLLMSFKERDFPTSLKSPFSSEVLWSSNLQPLPSIADEVLIQRCLSIDHTGLFTLEGSGGVGSYSVYVDEKLSAQHIFDIGKMQTFPVSFDENDRAVRYNIQALCNDTACPPVSICEENMIVDPKMVNFGGFTGISCSTLSELSRNGGINPQFAMLYPLDIGSRCGCHLVDCPLDEVSMELSIIFDRAPDVMLFSVVNETGSVLWDQNLAGSAISLENKLVIFAHCVQKDGPLFFTVIDSYQDGLCCGTDTEYTLPDGELRGYNISLDGELVGSRIFLIGSRQELILRAGKDSSPVHISQPPVWCQDCDWCRVCPDGASFKPDESMTFNLYGSVNCRHYSVNMSSYIDTSFCSMHQQHIASSCGCSNHEHMCKAGESKLSYHMILEDDLRDIIVQVRDHLNETLWSKVGFVGEIGETVRFEACIPSIEPVFVGIYKYCGDGILCSSDGPEKEEGYFEIYVDDELTYSDSLFQSANEVAIGSQYTLSPAIAPPSVAPTANAVIERGPEPPCSICGEGLEITKLHGIVEISSLLRTTCAEFAELGMMGHLPVDTCSDSVRLVGTPCGCANVATTSAPTAPIGGGGFEPGPNPSCNICGEGNEVTLFDPKVIIPGESIVPTCGEFAEGGFAGLIPAESCPLVAGLVFVLCGCAPTVSTPTPAVLLPATLAPVLGDGLESGPNPPCNICGEGNEVTLFDREVIIPREDIVTTCAEFSEEGLNGLIPAESCPLAVGLVFVLCGCTPAT